jgi:hypothetical protein
MLSTSFFEQPKHNPAYDDGFIDWYSHASFSGFFENAPDTGSGEAISSWLSLYVRAPQESTTGIGAIINENISDTYSPPDEIFYVFCRYGPSIDINLSPKSSSGGSALWRCGKGYGPSPGLKVNTDRQ